MTPKKFNLLLVILSVVIILLLVFLFPTDEVGQKKLKEEVANHLVELFLLVILGGILIEAYTRSYENEKAIKDLKKGFLSRIAGAYIKIKRVRRILEAGVREIEQHKKIPYSIYETQMSEMIDAQLEFEILKKRDALLFEGIFSKESSNRLKTAIDNFEENLNTLCEEYQKNNFKEGVINMSLLKELSKFIYDTKFFKSNFSTHYNDCIDLFKSELLANKKINVPVILHDDPEENMHIPLM